MSIADTFLAAATLIAADTVNHAGTLIIEASHSRHDCEVALVLGDECFAVIVGRSMSTLMHGGGQALHRNLRIHELSSLPGVV